VTRYLGVDFGSRRVGLAVSDALGLTARPLAVVGRRAAVRRIADLVAEHRVDKLVVGVPTGLSGGESESAAGARALARELERGLKLEVELVDERFTSKIAESALIESGMRRRDRRETVDKVAAAIILQGHLDSLRGSRRHDGDRGAEESHDC